MPLLGHLMGALGGEVCHPSSFTHGEMHAHIPLGFTSSWFLENGQFAQQLALMLDGKDLIDNGEGEKGAKI